MITAMHLSASERVELTKRARSRTGRAEDARRARVILLLADGRTWADIRNALACSDSYISRWAKRFVEDRQSGLYSRHQGSPARTLTPKLESKILNWTLKRKPTAGATRWSTRKLGRALGLSHMMIARVWTKHGLVA